MIVVQGLRSIVTKKLSYLMREFNLTQVDAQKLQRRQQTELKDSIADALLQRGFVKSIKVELDPPKEKTKIRTIKTEKEKDGNHS